MLSRVKICYPRRMIVLVRLYLNIRITPLYTCWDTCVMFI